MIDLDSVSIHRDKRGDVLELHHMLDVRTYLATILEYQMFLRILDTQLHAKGMKIIGKLWYMLVPSLPQRGPLYVFILIAPNRVVLLLDGIL